MTVLGRAGRSALAPDLVRGIVAVGAAITAVLACDRFAGHLDVCHDGRTRWGTMSPSVVTDELVLGLPRKRVLGDGTWRGVLYGDVAPYLDLIASHGEFRRAERGRDDPSWKQVIPYLVLRDRGSLFLMRRTRAGGDQRLHERYSIGIGGHVNPEDGGVTGGMAREWAEELEADWTPDFELVGLLNDDTDPVGAVHLGVVFRAEARGRRSRSARPRSSRASSWRPCR